jgi:hypothetical protein
MIPPFISYFLLEIGVPEDDLYRQSYELLSSKTRRKETAKEEMTNVE